MNQDARRQKNASEAEAAFKEGKVNPSNMVGIVLDQEENYEGEKKGNQKLGQRQQQEKYMGKRRSKREKDKKFPYELCGLSYFYKQGLSKHKKEPFIKQWNKNKRRLNNNEIIQNIQTEEEKENL